MADDSLRPFVVYNGNDVGHLIGATSEQDAMLRRLAQVIATARDRRQRIPWDALPARAEPWTRPATAVDDLYPAEVS